MSNIKVVMIVKLSALVETMQELGDVLAGENVVIKVEKDYVFDSIFDINTEKVDIDIDDDLLFYMMKSAHEKNITLNQYITEIIAKQIDEKEKKDFVVDKKSMFKPKAETSFVPNEDKFKKIHDFEEEEGITLSSKFRTDQKRVKKCANFGDNPCCEVPLEDIKPLSGLVDELLMTSSKPHI